MLRLTILLSLLLSVSWAANAQATCAAFLSDVLTTLENECADAGRGLCYGNSPLILEPVEDAEAVAFSRPGDIAPLATAASLTLSTFESEVRGWGVVQINTRLSHTEETLTLLALGGLTLENDGARAEDTPAVLSRVITDQGLNIRGEPNANAGLIASAFTGDVVRLGARTPDGAWVRVHLPDATVGWAVSSAFDANDLTGLETAEAGETYPYGSLQALFLVTGVQAANCPDAPPPGVLAQTPEDTNDTAALQFNGVPLRVAPASTVFLSTDADDALRVEVLEGAVTFPVNPDEPLQVAAGQGVVFEAGITPVPRRYDYNRVGRLPLVALPRTAYATVDFDVLLTPAEPDVNPLAGITSQDACTLAAVTEAANLRDLPDPSARVRHVMQVGESALPIGRGRGSDGVLWWQIVEDVWVSSNAVVAVGNCGTLPLKAVFR